MMFWYPSTMLMAASVISKRMRRISKGGKRASNEAQRMVTEKMFAAIEATTILATGGKPSKAMRCYRKRIGANNRRLR